MPDTIFGIHRHVPYIDGDWLIRRVVPHLLHCSLIRHLTVISHLYHSRYHYIQRWSAVLNIEQWLTRSLLLSSLSKQVL